MSLRDYRFATWFILPWFALSSLGCTILGAGIGHSIPKRGDIEIPTEIQTLHRGTDVAVVYRGSAEKGPNAPLSTIEGVYGGIDNDRAVVERGNQAYLIPLGQIEQTRARPWKGGYSLEGGLIGLGLDIAAVVFLYAYLQSTLNWESHDTPRQ